MVRAEETAPGLLGRGLLRLPLSVFVKLVNITFEIRGLEELLAHPVKRHYLIRHLPTDIRSRLLFQRKYIFSVHELATRLCFIGVLQFGPQKLKEKDQVFLYMNERASLINTVNCTPHYHRTDYEEGKEFVTKKYFFVRLEEIEKYWCVCSCVNRSLFSQFD